MNNNIFRSRAPLRISFAGGGTDLPPYCEEHGGQVISTTINKYVYVSVEIKDEIPNSQSTNGMIRIFAYDLGKQTEIKIPSDPEITFRYDGNFDIFKAVLNRFHIRTPCDIHVHSDLPAGSGMGTSSSLTVALIGVFAKLKNQEISKYETAEMACEIERHELEQTGGYQDQYAAAFGGFNFIKFTDDVKVYSLTLDPNFLEELNYRLLLCYTGKTHISAEIQDEVLSNYEKVDFNEGMRLLKLRAKQMRDVLVKQNPKMLEEWGRLQHLAWVAKKKLSQKISNEDIEKLYQYSRKHGALGGKLLG